MGLIQCRRAGARLARRLLFGLPWLLIAGCSNEQRPATATAGNAGAPATSGGTGGAPQAETSGTAGATAGKSGGAGRAGASGGTAGAASGTGGSAGSSAGKASIDENLEPCPEGTTCECNDGIDNDGDGLVDWQFDLGCTARNDSREGGLATGDRKGGWTVFEPAMDTRIVYVSADGSDSSDGLAPERSGSSGPKQSLRAGLSQLRAGSADWLLLRRGDRFSGLDLNVAGRSPSEPIVISSYGTDTTRPIIEDEEIEYSQAGNLAIAHLHFAGTLFSFGGNAGHVSIEGCLFEGGNVVSSEGLSGLRRDLTLRRNVLARTNTPFYFASIDGLLIEENVIYRPSEDDGGNHGMYLQRDDASNVTTRGNLVYYGKPAGDGIKQRPGGLSEGNVVANVEWSAIHFEGQPPLTGVARGNLILERRTPNSGAITYANGWSGEAVDNIVADEPRSIDSATVNGPAGITRTRNVQLFLPADPDRSTVTILGLYSEDRLGGEPTTVAFFEAAIQQRKFAFRPELTAASVIAFVRENYVP